MFYTHGNPVALLLLTEASGTQHQSRKRVTGPHAALEWCVKHHAKFVYLPPDFSIN